MTRLTYNAREKEMAKQAHLYDRMAASLRAQAIESALDRKRAREGV